MELTGCCALNGIHGNPPPQALVGVLRREQNLVLKLKANPTALILASRLLTAALHKSRNWPESLAKVGGVPVCVCVCVCVFSV